MGEAHLNKAQGFRRERNWVQSLRFSELALTCLKKLKARPLEVIQTIDDAMTAKYDALNFLDQNKEALECAKERYSLWAAGNMRHHGMLRAAFPLIDSLLNNDECEQAELIARTAYEMITARYDNIIPEDQRQQFLAYGSQLLSRATHRLAESGGIAPEGKQNAGEKAIALARKALEIHTQLHGAVSHQAANAMGVLADVLQYFNNVDDDEILRLYKQAKAIYCQVQGNLSPNVPACDYSLAAEYKARAGRAFHSKDLDRYMANLELALTHYRAAEQVYRTINHVDAADRAAQGVTEMEELLIEIRNARI